MSSSLAISFGFLLLFYQIDTIGRMIWQNQLLEDSDNLCIFYGNPLDVVKSLEWRINSFQLINKARLVVVPLFLQKVGRSRLLVLVVCKKYHPTKQDLSRKVGTCEGWMG